MERLAAVCCPCRPARSAGGELVVSPKKASMGRSGSNRVTKVSRSRGSSQELLEHVPLPTESSCCEITLEVVENLLEDSDEWPLRRAHAPAWSRAPHQEIGRKAVKRGEPHESSALFACQPAETLFALLGVLPIFGPPALPPSLSRSAPY